MPFLNKNIGPIYNQQRRKSLVLASKIILSLEVPIRVGWETHILPEEPMLKLGQYFKVLVSGMTSKCPLLKF